MGGIAQDFDRVLQFGFGGHFGRDDVSNDKTAAGPQYAEDFRHRPAGLLEMMHRQPRHYGVESAIAKRQLIGRALAEADVAEPGLAAALCRVLQHLRGEIESHHVPGGPCNRRTENARTAGDIEHRPPHRTAERIDKTLRQRRVGDCG